MLTPEISKRIAQHLPALLQQVNELAPFTLKHHAAMLLHATVEVATGEGNEATEELIDSVLNSTLGMSLDMSATDLITGEARDPQEVEQSKQKLIAHEENAKVHLDADDTGVVDNAIDVANDIWQIMAPEGAGSFADNVVRILADAMIPSLLGEEQEDE